MAGIVGNIMLRYCLFGDTMNTASRMRTYGAQIILQQVDPFKIKIQGTLAKLWTFKESRDNPSKVVKLPIMSPGAEDMEIANKIHISESTYMALKKIGGFRTKFRGNLNIKGKGIMKTFWIVDETWDDLEGGVNANTSTSDSNLPGELMAYSTAQQRKTMKTDSEFSEWKEEDVFLSGCKLMIDCT